ncbi:MAG TPA: glycoside hydrolase domain-containing protein [archaeon]|nr:glycoside hydrolase domain-containing protein [archaeon]
MRKIFLTLLLISCAGAAQAKVEVWTRSCLEPLVREAAPPEILDKSISLRVTPGEYEPAVFAVRSDKPIAVTVSPSGLEGFDWLPAAWCELHKVVGLSDSTRPNRLFEFSGLVELKPGSTEFFWLTIRPPENARPGIYNGRIFLQSVHEMQQIEISCEVLPFRLAENPIPGGAFMAATNLPGCWYRDMKEHGLDAIQYFWAYEARVTRRGDKLVLDLSRMDDLMADLEASGMKGPVVISLGNDYHLHYERRIAEVFGIPIDTSAVMDGKRIVGPKVSPRLDSLFVEGLRQIRDHWKAKAYPQELVVLIYDEPTERLLERCKNRYDLLKTVMPDTRVYGVVMDRREWARSMVDQCDIIVCNGDFAGCLDVAQKYNKGFWVYGAPLANAHTARYDMGCLPWRVKAQGFFLWMYNYWDYDPDGCAVYRHPEDPDKPVRSVSWEALREGMDDLRYFATAERLIERAPEKKKTVFKKRLDQVRDSIEPEHRRRRPAGKTPGQMSLLEYYNEPQRVRNEVIEIILELL